MSFNKAFAYGAISIVAVISPSVNATSVGGIISTDTVWSNTASPYIISSDIQVKNGVTLTIMPGVTIGSGNIKVYGNLNVDGSVDNKVLFNGTNIVPGANPNSSNLFNINIESSIFNGGSIYSATGNAIYGSLTLQNSVLNNTGNMYLWYPKANVSIRGNEFLGSGGISVGTMSGITVDIRNNLFKDWTGGYGDTYAVENWASYDTSKTLVEFNTFFNPGRVAVMLPGGYGSAAMTATNNYWGTTDLTTIQSMIYDNNVDLSSAGAIAFQPYLMASSLLTPQAAVPEADTSAMLLTGLGIVGFMARRRKNTKA